MKSAKQIVKLPKAKPAKPASEPTKALPIHVSNPDKVFWPEEGYTKLQLIEFYSAIFPQLQPYVKDRILSLERCPDGMRGGCFYQKEAPSSMPPGTPTKKIAHAGKSNKSTNYVVGGALATQLALANLGCIAVHVSGSRASSLRQPDWVCFDLDPQSGKFSDAAGAGLRLKEVLDVLKLESFPKLPAAGGSTFSFPSAPGLMSTKFCLSLKRWWPASRRSIRKSSPSNIPSRHAGNAFISTPIATVSARRWWLRTPSAAAPRRRFPRRWHGRKSNPRSILPLSTSAILKSGFAHETRGRTSSRAANPWPLQ